MKKLIFVSGLLLCACISLVAQNEPRAIQGGILNGKAISLPKPEYPESAKASGIEGTVNVKVVIDENGNVTSAEAASEPQKQFKPCSDEFEYASVPDASLREAAERAALAAKFSPTLLSGEPVKVSGTITYRFVAADKPAADSVQTVTGGIMNVRADYLPAPKYPPAARAVRASGVVNVQVLIDVNGQIASADAVSGHPLLRAAAVCAAREARFAPTMLSGEPVRVSGTIAYNFVAPDVAKDQ